LLSGGCSQFRLRLGLCCCEFLLRDSGFFCFICVLTILFRFIEGFLLCGFVVCCSFLLSLRSLDLRDALMKNIVIRVSGKTGAP
jgi:hypothetical protein